MSVDRAGGADSADSAGYVGWGGGWACGGHPNLPRPRGSAQEARSTLGEFNRIRGPLGNEIWGR